MKPKETIEEKLVIYMQESEKRFKEEVKAEANKFA